MIYDKPTNNHDAYAKCQAEEIFWQLFVQERFARASIASSTRVPHKAVCYYTRGVTVSGSPLEPALSLQ